MTEGSTVGSVIARADSHVVLHFWIERKPVVILRNRLSEIEISMCSDLWTAYSNAFLCPVSGESDK